MAAIETTRSAHAAPLGGIITRAIGTVIAWRDARATRKALSQLSDRALADIGLTRSEIDEIASRG